MLAGPRPWRYAHLYTPDEHAPPRRRSDPPGDDDAEGGADAGTQGEDSEDDEPQPHAPVHAVLMDGAPQRTRISPRADVSHSGAHIVHHSLVAVVAAERTADGRLYLVVRALSRLRVRGSVGVTPAGSPMFACELAPDSEEAQARGTSLCMQRTHVALNGCS